MNTTSESAGVCTCKCLFVCCVVIVLLLGFDSEEADTASQLHSSRCACVFYSITSFMTLCMVLALRAVVYLQQGVGPIPTSPSAHPALKSTDLLS